MLNNLFKGILMVPRQGNGVQLYSKKDQLNFYSSFEKFYNDN